MCVCVCVLDLCRGGSLLQPKTTFVNISSPINILSKNSIMSSTNLPSDDKQFVDRQVYRICWFKYLLMFYRSWEIYYE